MGINELAFIDDIKVKIGSPNDTASMDSTLFAGQQKVYDAIGSPNDAPSKTTTIFAGLAHLRNYIFGGPLANKYKGNSYSSGVTGNAGFTQVYTKNVTAPWLMLTGVKSTSSLADQWTRLVVDYYNTGSWLVIGSVAADGEIIARFSAGHSAEQIPMPIFIPSGGNIKVEVKHTVGGDQTVSGYINFLEAV